MLDDEISPQVCVYKLEDITKTSDESIDELVDRICQFTCRAQISNDSDAAIEFEVQCRLIRAIPDTDIKLCKQLLKVSCDKKVLHLLEICRTYYAVESGVAAMCAGHAVHAVCHTCQPHDPKPQSSYAPCPTCLLETQHVKVVGKKVTSEQNAADLAPLVCKCPIINPGSRVVKRGENHKLPKPKQRKDPHTKPCSCCSGLQNSRRHAPKGDDHWQHQFPAVQWGVHGHKTACKHQQ